MKLSLVYTDICGSIKEMRPILEQLSTKQFIKGALVACTICARDGDKKDETSLDFVTILMMEMYQSLLQTNKKWAIIGEQDRIKYGNMCTIVMRALN